MSTRMDHDLAPVGGGDHHDLSAKRRQFAGESGFKGLISNGRTFAIALFASLGGLVYGYNQGMFSSILTMHAFQNRIQGYAEKTGAQQAIVTAILELGAWIGSLMNGYLADAIGRRMTTVVAVGVFSVGVIVQANTASVSYIFAGRFVTGLGVGSLSMIVPLYNAELAPPEIRGSLVAVQQLAITFGIMVSFWIGYGCNFIGGTGDTQSNAAWLIPVCIQLIPALILGAGMAFFMPQSPRHLINQGREEECLKVLSWLRNKSPDDIGVRIEFLEVKAMYLFEKETAAAKYPQYQDGSRHSNFMILVNDYKSLVTNPSLFRRSAVACLVMTFQQWNGINAINYYAPFIFRGIGLGGSTLELLATGVVGIMEFVFTIPAVLYVDKFGRKSILLAGAIGMASCHFIVAGIIGGYEGHFDTNRNAAWAGVAFIWIFIINFAYSWGPVAWIVVSEVFPLSMRAKGVALGGSSNWLNNFAVGMATSPFINASQLGTFIFFGAITVVGALYVFFLVPETKGRTLEEMDELFGATGMAIADEERKSRIEREIGLLALLGADDSPEPMMHSPLGDDAKVYQEHADIPREKA
ncbi:MFS-type Sugar/inositol transporter [Penicillium ucsense]|uniref:MFS-type Sugar/inositol transporter n=1 Tax=Penicillium ucsense TaxID=2839758 RepID=A0A8J8VVX1_9EURO|nr:MFS-type Sugar/inositol transporter [Penicillium ucsense]KAF7729293.1 MFS-type Sugar/inositol transporter [Penicillium ucsense]